MNALIFAILVFPFHQLRGQTFTTPLIDGTPIGYEVHDNGAFSLVFVPGWSCDSNKYKTHYISAMVLTRALSGITPYGKNHFLPIN